MPNKPTKKFQDRANKYMALQPSPKAEPKFIENDRQQSIRDNNRIEAMEHTKSVKKDGGEAFRRAMKIQKYEDGVQSVTNKYGQKLTKTGDKYTNKHGVEVTESGAPKMNIKKDTPPGKMREVSDAGKELIPKPVKKEASAKGSMKLTAQEKLRAEARKAELAYDADPKTKGTKWEGKYPSPVIGGEPQPEGITPMGKAMGLWQNKGGRVPTDSSVKEANITNTPTTKTTTSTRKMSKLEAWQKARNEANHKKNAESSAAVGNSILDALSWTKKFIDGRQADLERGKKKQ